MTMRPGPDDIVYLLGAGASRPANIWVATEMVQRLEEGFKHSYGKKKAHWSKHEELYWHIKSSIHYAQGLEGKFNEAVEFNIETLVNTLGELTRHVKHPLYPFIGTWNQRFLELAGPKFENVESFRVSVLAALQDWILVEDLNKKTAYFDGLKELRKSLEYPLRIFSLNYDRSVETLENTDKASMFHVEQGFGLPNSEAEQNWDWRRMLSDLTSRDNIESPNVDLLLYKLHGSIDWVRNEDERLIYRAEGAQNIEPDTVQIIFGKEAKMDARDPFSFYFSEFRKACKAARLLIVIGYSFGDSHINQILSGALREKTTEKKLLAVCRPLKKEEENQKSAADEAHYIAAKLVGECKDKDREVAWDKSIKSFQSLIAVDFSGAEKFLKNTKSWKQLAKWFPETKDPFA